MKLGQLDESTILINEISRSAGPEDILGMGADYYDDLENAYTDFEKLEVAFETGNFGTLINRRPDQITERDITVIKNKILQILVDNPFLRGQNFEGKTGREVVRLLGMVVGHGIEATLLTALTAAFGGIAAEETLHGDAILGVLSGLGVAAGAAGVMLQVKTIKAVWAAYRLVKIMDAFEKAHDFDPGAYKRGMFRKFLDYIEGKTPDQIRREAERRIMDAAMEKQLKFQAEVKHLPESFTYRDNKGITQTYPTYKLFEFD